MVRLVFAIPRPADRDRASTPMSSPPEDSVAAPAKRRPVTRILLYVGAAVILAVIAIRPLRDAVALLIMGMIIMAGGMHYDGPEPVVAPAVEALAPEAVATEGVAVSPAGHVYFGTGEGVVYRLGPGDTPEVFADLSTILPGDEPPSLCQLTFAPNGDLYVAHCGRSALHRITPDGTVTTLDTNLALPNFVLWHPGGYVFLTDSEANVLYRYDPDGGNRVTILEGVTYPNGFAFTPDGRAMLLNSLDKGTVYRVELTDTYARAGPPTVVQFFGKHFFQKALLDGMLRLPDGTYLTCDFFGNQLIRFREDGTAVQRIALGAAVNGEPIFPASLAITPSGDVYVTNLGHVLKQAWGRGVYRFPLPPLP